MQNYRVSTFESKFKPAFRDLNLAWIEKYFKVEAKDIEQTSHPEECLAGGGEIFFIVVADEAIATCALYQMAPRIYELAKMAVRPDFQGNGYGDVLIHEAESWAKNQGVKEIMMLSNTNLAPAITLYHKHGYETVQLGPHPHYERCNIELRKHF